MMVRLIMQCSGSNLEPYNGADKDICNGVERRNQRAEDVA